MTQEPGPGGDVILDLVAPSGVIYRLKNQRDGLGGGRDHHGHGQRVGRTSQRNLAVARE